MAKKEQMRGKVAPIVDEAHSYFGKANNGESSQSIKMKELMKEMKSGYTFITAAPGDLPAALLDIGADPTRLEFVPGVTPPDYYGVDVEYLKRFTPPEGVEEFDYDKNYNAKTFFGRSNGSKSKWSAADLKTAIETKEWAPGHAAFFDNFIAEKGMLLERATNNRDAGATQEHLAASVIQRYGDEVVAIIVAGQATGFTSSSIFGAQISGEMRKSRVLVLHGKDIHNLKSVHGFNSFKEAMRDEKVKKLCENKAVYVCTNMDGGSITYIFDRAITHLLVNITDINKEVNMGGRVAHTNPNAAMMRDAAGKPLAFIACSPSVYQDLTKNYIEMCATMVAKFKAGQLANHSVPMSPGAVDCAKRHQVGNPKLTGPLIKRLKREAGGGTAVIAATVAAAAEAGAAAAAVTPTVTRAYDEIHTFTLNEDQHNALMQYLAANKAGDFRSATEYAALFPSSIVKQCVYIKHPTQRSGTSIHRNTNGCPLKQTRHRDMWQYNPATRTVTYVRRIWIPDAGSTNFTFHVFVDDRKGAPGDVRMETHTGSGKPETGGSCVCCSKVSFRGTI